MNAKLINKFQQRPNHNIIIIFSAMILMSSVQSSSALWFFQQKFQQQQQQQLTLDESIQSIVQEPQQLINTTQATKLQEQLVQEVTNSPTSGISSYTSYGSSLLSIAGIQPSSIAALLNTVGDTGFRYFNIQDQCRNRAACDLGYMLYNKLSFVHNWLIRTSVRTLTDMNNVYSQSWMEGMMGRNCTAIYLSCRQSPLEGLMNLALIQHLAS